MLKNTSTSQEFRLQELSLSQNAVRVADSSRPLTICQLGRSLLFTKKLTKKYSAGGCKTEIDFVFVGEKYRKYVRDVKVIPWELHHRLVVVDLNKKVLKKVVRKQRIIRRKI